MQFAVIFSFEMGMVDEDYCGIGESVWIMSLNAHLDAIIPMQLYRRHVYMLEGVTKTGDSPFMGPSHFHSGHISSLTYMSTF